MEHAPAPLHPPCLRLTPSARCPLLYFTETLGLVAFLGFFCVFVVAKISTKCEPSSEGLQEPDREWG